MKNKTFYIRMINILLIAIILIVYQSMVTVRDRNEEISKLEAKVESYETFIAEAKEAGVVTSEDDAEDGSNSYNDGTYTGSADGFGGTITVDVTIADGKITDIEIVEADGEDTAYLTMAKDIVDDILTEQTAEVDTVSGATFSSTGIKNAVASALENAQALEEAAK